MHARTAFAVLLATICGTGAADSQTVLTVDRVLHLVAQQHPQVLVAKARVRQAEGALTTARAPLSTNPEVDLFLGSRRVVGGRSPEFELSLAQRFEVAGQRGQRINAAITGVRQQEHEVAAAILEAQTAALMALYRAAHAQGVREVTDEALRLAQEVVAAAQARYDAGETAILDVNVARVEEARARRDLLAAEAGLEGTLGLLRELLALSSDETVRVETTLRAPEVPEIDALLSQLSARADLLALGAVAAQSEAELRLAKSARVPDLYGGVGFRREDGEPIVGLRFGVSLPIFQRHGGAIATASARLTESNTALEARRRALDARLRAAHARYVVTRRAAEAFSSAALPLLRENEELVRQSYQAGKIGLLELLVLRREGFAARREALDAQLEASLAAVEVRGLAGSLR